MARVCLLVSARSGSTFLNNVLIGAMHSGKDNMVNTDPKDIKFPITLESDPPALYFDLNNGSRKDVDIITNIPEVYITYVPTEATQDWLNSFPGPRDSWTFIYLLRDPKNRIPSWIQWEIKNDSANFELQDTIFREQVQVFKTCWNSLQTMLVDDRFHLFFFESLVNNPLHTLEKMFEVSNIKINTAFYKNVIKDYLNVSNSSYADQGQKANERWKNLTDKQLSYFTQKVGHEYNAYLNYKAIKE